VHGFYIIYIVCSIFTGAWFLLFVYIYVALGDPVIKREIPLNNLTPPHICACPKPGSEYPTHMLWSFLYAMV
jgi:hypothetical protein